MTLSPIFSTARMQYETPRGGITLGGYVSRRLHKTILLKPIADWLNTDPMRALSQLGIYAAAASTSFGPAMYQPDSDPTGAVIETIDPETGARVTLISERYAHFTYRIEMDGVGVLSGSETITGTTVGLRGLGMPAPTRFDFVSAQGDYRAEIVGIITSELSPGFRNVKIRGYGTLDMSDNQGNHGKLTLDRSGLLVVSLTARDGKNLVLKERLV